MSFRHEYNQELTGVTFDELDDLIASALGGGEAGGGSARPLEGISETDLRVLAHAGLITQEDWIAEYVARGDTQQQAAVKVNRQWQEGISTAAATRGQFTASEQAKINAVQQSGFAMPTPAPTAIPGAAGSGGGAGGAGDANLVAANAGSALASATATGSAGGVNDISAAAPPNGAVGPDGRTVQQMAGTAYQSEEERAWYLAQPAAQRAAAEQAARARAGGSSQGTGAGGSTKPAASGRIGQLIDSFEGFSDKDVINAYYQGEITRDELKAVIDIRNTSTNKDGSTTSKYTDASLNRYLDQIDAQKPQKKLTKADLLGPQASNLAARFNPRAEGFGGEVPISTSRGFSGTFDSLFGPDSGGTGAIVAFDQSGNPEVSHWSLGGQQMAATDSNPSIWGTTTQDILAMRGRKPTGDPVKDAEMLSESLATSAMNAEAYPNATPSDLQRMQIIGLTGHDPASRRVDPSSGRFADLMSSPEPIEPYAGGGRVAVNSRDLEPYAGGGRVTRIPIIDDEPEPMARVPRNDEDWMDPYREAARARADRRSALAEQESDALAASLEAGKAARRRQALAYRWEMAGLPWATEIAKPLFTSAGNLPIGFDWLFEPEDVRERRRDALLNPQPVATAAAAPLSKRGSSGIRGYFDGGDMVTEEPIIGIGLRTHEPRFVVSEGEMLNIEPLDKSAAATRGRQQQEEAIIGAASLLSEGGRKALSTLVHGRVA